MADTIEWVTSGRRLAEIAPPWSELLGPGATPFDRPEWFSAWWSAFAGGADLRVCTVWRGGRLVAVLPLQRRSRYELTALANDHSPLFRPLAADTPALGEVVAAVLGGGTEISPPRHPRRSIATSHAPSTSAANCFCRASSSMASSWPST